MERTWITHQFFKVEAHGVFQAVALSPNSPLVIGFARHALLQLAPTSAARAQSPSEPTKYWGTRFHVFTKIQPVQ